MQARNGGGVGAGARAWPQVSSAAPLSAARSPAPGTPILRRPVGPITRPMGSRFRPRVATGHASRSWIPTATWSAGAGGRGSSARRTDSGVTNTFDPVGARSAAGFLLRGRSPRRGAAPHVVEDGRRRPAVDLEGVRLLIGAERGAGQ